MNETAGSITDPEVRDLALYAALLRDEYVKDERDPWRDSPFGWIKIRPSRQVGAIGERRPGCSSSYRKSWLGIRSSRSMGQNLSALTDSEPSFFCRTPSTIRPEEDTIVRRCFLSWSGMTTA